MSCGEQRRERERESEAPFQKRPYMYAYSTVILHAFPLFTVWIINEETTTIIVLLFFSCVVRRTATERRGAPFQKRPYMFAYSMVILNAFPFITVNKKLSLEVTSKLERLEYSYKHCIDEEDTIIVCVVRRLSLCLYFGAETLEVHSTKRYDLSKFTVFIRK